MLVIFEDLEFEKMRYGANLIAHLTVEVIAK